MEYIRVYQVFPNTTEVYGFAILTSPLDSQRIGHTWPMSGAVLQHSSNCFNRTKCRVRMAKQSSSVTHRRFAKGFIVKALLPWFLDAPNYGSVYPCLLNGSYNWVEGGHVSTRKFWWTSLVEVCSCIKSMSSKSVHYLLRQHTEFWCNQKGNKTFWHEWSIQCPNVVPPYILDAEHHVVLKFNTIPPAWYWYTIYCVDFSWTCRTQNKNMCLIYCHQYQRLWRLVTEQSLNRIKQ